MGRPSTQTALPADALQALAPAGYRTVKERDAAIGREVAQRLGYERAFTSRAVREWRIKGRAPRHVVDAITASARPAADDPRDRQLTQLWQTMRMAAALLDQSVELTLALRLVLKDVFDTALRESGPHSDHTQPPHGIPAASVAASLAKAPAHIAGNRVTQREQPASGAAEMYAFNFESFQTERVRPYLRFFRSVNFARSTDEAGT